MRCTLGDLNVAVAAFVSFARGVPLNPDADACKSQSRQMHVLISSRLSVFYFLSSPFLLYGPIRYFIHHFSASIWYKLVG